MFVIYLRCSLQYIQDWFADLKLEIQHISLPKGTLLVLNKLKLVIHCFKNPTRVKIEQYESQEL